MHGDGMALPFSSAQFELALQQQILINTAPQNFHEQRKLVKKARFLPIGMVTDIGSRQNTGTVSSRNYKLLRIYALESSY